MEGLSGPGAQVQRQLLSGIPDETGGGRHVEGASGVEEQEQDEDLRCALALAHHRRGCSHLFPPLA